MKSTDAWRVTPPTQKEPDRLSRIIASIFRRREPTTYQRALAIHIAAASSPKSALR